MKYKNDIKIHLGIALFGLRFLSDEEIDKAISLLSKNQQFVIRHRYIRPKTLEEIAGMLGVTRERIRQIEFHALRKLRKYFEQPPKKLEE